MSEPFRIQLSNGVIIECVSGDITSQPDMDAVVNAANAELRTGGGVAGAVHRAAGPELDAECRPLAPIRPGQAVITGAGRLPNKYVIHCLGPVYGVDQPSDQLLAECFRNALLRAEEVQARSIAFPAISTGAFGYPIQEAATVSVAAIAKELPMCTHLRRLRFVLFSSSDLQVYSQSFRAEFES
ncbi:MAG: macro domain-containing protein [Spirochaetaceae bacterium]|nr:MAG: macro domain-containing protein [Spirochaetaceae bacterium]